ncbi:deoxyribodipyrimidine photolyase, partial [Vibrio parahaemolyticus]
NPCPVVKVKEDLFVHEQYHGPTRAFKDMALQPFGSILSSIAKKRDEEVEKIIPLRRFLDSYLIDPKIILKSDQKPYKVFTPFYNYLEPLHQS